MQLWPRRHGRAQFTVTCSKRAQTTPLSRRGLDWLSSTTRLACRLTSARQLPDVANVTETTREKSNSTIQLKHNWTYKIFPICKDLHLLVPLVYFPTGKKYLLLFLWRIQLLLLLILVAGLLSPGLPWLWRFVLTRATVATHPLPSLPLLCADWLNAAKLS